MLTVKENERLTRVGPGTPMGELLRRYWQPIGAAAELDDNPVKPIKLLGESLVLYRDRQGRLGLIGDTCPHRRTSMLYGIPENEGLRCPYHGWMFDGTGQCIEMPAEAPDSTFPSRVRMPGYPVEELCGLIFAYLRPAPATAAPLGYVRVGQRVAGYRRHRHPLQLVADHGELPGPGACGVAARPLFQLRAGTVGASGFTAEVYRPGTNGVTSRWEHEKIGFDEFQYGIIKRRVVAGRSNRTRNGASGIPSCSRISCAWVAIFSIASRWTTHTPCTCGSRRTPASWWEVPKQDKIPFYQVPLPTDEEGQMDWRLLDNNSGQDIMAWITQGAIADRSLEKLGESDKGIILYRRMLRQQLAIVEAGGEPMNVFRDPTKRTCALICPGRDEMTPWAYAQRGIMRRTGQAGKYAPVLRDMVARFAGEKALEGPVH